MTNTNVLVYVQAALTTQYVIVLQLRDALKMLKSLKEVQVMILRSSVPGVFCAGVWTWSSSS